MERKFDLSQASRDPYLRGFLEQRLETVKEQLISTTVTEELLELQGRARELKKLLSTLEKNEG